MVETVLLLGAGFSRWAANLPLVSELFDFEIDPGNDREARRLEIVSEAYGRWRSQYPLESNEQFIAWARTNLKRFDYAGWYVTRRLTDPFISGSYIRRTFYINSYYARENYGVIRARQFLQNCELAFGYPAILTANYDLLVEYALGTKGFNYGRPGEYIGTTPYPHIQPVYVTGPVPLLKLHGSLSWSVDGKSTTSRFGMTGKCLIVPPMAEKTPHETFAWEWAEAARHLKRARRLVIFGFAFNPYDQAIRTLFRTNSENLEELISIDPFDQRARLAEVFTCGNVRWLDPNDGILLP